MSLESSLEIDFFYIRAVMRKVVSVGTPCRTLWLNTWQLSSYVAGDSKIKLQPWIAVIKIDRYWTRCNVEPETSEIGGYSSWNHMTKPPDAM